MMRARRVRGRAPAFLALALCAAVPTLAVADGAPVALTLSFEQSRDRLLERSDALMGAEAGISAARSQADTTKALRLPRVGLDVQGLRYQKTVNLSLQGLREHAEGAATGMLDDIAGRGVPGVSDDAVNRVITEVQSALPGMFAQFPDAIGVRSRRSLLHANLSAIMPLYAGGAIAASQAAARAGLDLAAAKKSGVHESLQFALVKAYFGQVLATEVLAVARTTRDGFEHHLDDARKLEKHGQISHARVLQVTVARDSAQRAVDAAEGNQRAAVEELAHLLRSEQPVAPSNPLFVDSAPLAPVDTFVNAAQGQQPKLREAHAAVEATRHGVRMAHARKLPSVYAFGSYNLNRRHALITEPDWIVGVGMHYTLWPRADRNAAESAAQARNDAAEAAAREVWVETQTAIHKTWNLTEAARRQFLSLQSSIAAATESLRVAELSFREGVANAAELIDARNALAQVQTERATVAYKYDLGLASLLLASGAGDTFADYLLRADVRVTTP